MPKYVSATTKEKLCKSYEEFGSFDKAAKALGIQRHRIVRAVYESRRLCPQCVKPLDRNGSLCTACLEKLNQSAKKRYGALKKSGFCTRCHKPTDREGLTRCDKCLQHESKTNQSRRKNRIATGTCIYCQSPSISDSKYCENHLLKQRRKGRQDLSNSYFSGNRDAILERDHYTCQICKDMVARPEVHHIDNNRYNNDLLNLITLCRACHSVVTFLTYSKNPKAVYDFFVAHKRI